MPIINHFPLQKAVYQTLTGDVSLMNLITGVFDRPPQGTSFPYITFGDATAADWSSKTTSGMEQVLTIMAWSREGGRKQAANLMERVHTLLHEADLAVEGQTLVLLRFLASQIQLENDGWTYRGSMRFSALLESN